MPVRIEGLEQNAVQPVVQGTGAPQVVPEGEGHDLEPVKLTVDPDLKGRKRRLAAGAALYGIMSDLVFRTTSTDRTVFQAVVEAAHVHGRRT